MPKLVIAPMLAALAIAVPAAAAASEKVTLALNWVPTADHAPYFYAKRQGWYDQAGIELTIENGSGSAVSAQRVGAGQSDFGIADMATAQPASEGRLAQKPCHRHHQRLLQRS